MADRFRNWKPSRRARRWSLLGVSVAGLILAAVGMYAAVETAVNSNVEKGLISMRAANVGTVSLWLDEQLEKARSLAHVQANLTDADDLALGPIDSFISTGLITAAAIQDEKGVLLTETSAEFAARINDLDFDAAPFDAVRTAFSVLEGHASFLVRVPLKAGAGSDFKSLIVVFPLDSLSRSLRVSQFGNTGEAYLVRADGMLLTPPRFLHTLMAHGLSAGSWAEAERLFARDPGGDLTAGFQPDIPPVEWPLTLAARRVTAGETGVDIGGYRDYRGVEVFGGWSWIDRYGVGVIAEMDSSEAYSSLTTLRATALSMALVLLLSVALLALLWQLIRRSRLRRRHARSQYQAQMSRLNEALASTRGRFDALFERLSMGVGIIEPGTDGFRCNTAMAETLGYSREQLQARPQLLFGRPHETDLARTCYEELIAGKRDSYTVEKRYVHPDGYSVWTLLNASLVRDDTGAAAYAIVMLQPITEIKRANQALEAANRELKASRKLLEIAVESTQLGVWDWDVQGGKFNWDRMCCEIMRYPGESAVVTVDESFSRIAENAPAIIAHVEQALASGAPGYSIECRMRRYDGEVIDVLFRAAIERDEQGQPLHMIGSMLDITDLRSVERALATSNRELEASRKLLDIALASARVGVWHWDVPEARIHWDRSTAKLLGAGDESRDLGVEDAFAPVLAADRALLAQSMEAAMAGDSRSYSGEFRAVRRDGPIIECVVHSYIERDEDGEAVRLIGSIMDVTETRATERALVEARDEAERANRAKSAFLANMSHEIRTPLNAIMGFAQIGAKDKSAPPDAHRRASMILQSSRHLLRLIDDVLDLSKIEAGRITVRTEPVDLQDLIDELDRSYQMRAHHAGIGWKIRRDRDMPRWIEGDEARIRQVLINLLDNALKFTARGWIGLEVHSRRQADDHRICLEVVDTGPGVSKEDRERIFERFEQTKAGRKTLGGTGLGLAISRQLARVMGGDLHVSDGPDGGSRFRFSLVTREARAIEAVSRDIRGIIEPEQVGQVLIVDDEASNRAVLAEMLDAVGFGVMEAVEGQAALDLIRSRAPAAMLLDLHMLGMDGMQVLAQLQEMDLPRRPYIIVISGSASADDRQRALQAGANAFMAKPVNQDLLLTLLAEGMGVEYLVGASREEEEPPGCPRSSHSIEGLPEAVRDAMRAAIIAADWEAVLEEAKAIAATHPELARDVRQLAEQFDFAALEQLFSAERPKEDSGQ